MSWKPSQNSGLTYEKHDRKAKKYRDELDRIMVEWNPPTFKQLNYLSKCFYLWFLNESKKSKALTGVNHPQEIFPNYCPNYYLNLFKNNIDYIYKPLIKIIQ